MSEYEKIKNALIPVIKRVLPDHKVFADDIKTLNDAITNQHISDYVHISLAPITNTKEGKLINRNYQVGIMIHSFDETLAGYHDIGERLDKAFYPVLHFDDRFISVGDTTAAIVDWRLHYKFNLQYTDTYEHEDEETPYLDDFDLNMN